MASHGFFCESPSHSGHVCRKRDIEPNRTGLSLSFKDRTSSPSRPCTGLRPPSLAGCTSPRHPPPGGLVCPLHIPSLFELCLLRLVTTALSGTVSSWTILPVPSEGCPPRPPTTRGGSHPWWDLLSPPSFSLTASTPVVLKVWVPSGTWGPVRKQTP